MGMFELNEEILSLLCDVEKIQFMLEELGDYDCDYEITPAKALQYARNESKEYDCEMSFKFCAYHKRIMHIYHILQDYIYKTSDKLEKLLSDTEKEISK